MSTRKGNKGHARCAGRSKVKRRRAERRGIRKSVRKQYSKV